MKWTRPMSGAIGIADGVGQLSGAVAETFLDPPLAGCFDSALASVAGHSATSGFLVAAPLGGAGCGVSALYQAVGHVLRAQAEAHSP